MRDKDKRKQGRPKRERKRKGRPRKICQHMNCGSDAVPSLRSIPFNLYKSELSVPSIQISIGKTKQTLIIDGKKKKKRKTAKPGTKTKTIPSQLARLSPLVFFTSFGK
ncbi:hypothetical protein GBA52_001138 [Prunus armeniaca]|nr:hypothetical protein GBA52_001138 [Prunus armeniaca]